MRQLYEAHRAEVNRAAIVNLNELHASGSPYRRGRALISETAALTSMSAGGSGEDAVPDLKTRLLAHVAGLDRGFAATRRQVPNWRDTHHSMPCWCCTHYTHTLSVLCSFHTEKLAAAAPSIHVQGWQSRLMYLL